MRFACQTVFAIMTLGLLMNAIRADDAKKDQEKLQGTWSVVSAEADGTATDEIKNDKLVFAGDKITIKKAGGDEEHVTFTLDTSKKPKQIDINADGKMIQAIYELDGDKLKVCAAMPGADRPTDFTTKAGSNRMLVTLKREN